MKKLLVIVCLALVAPALAQEMATERTARERRLPPGVAAHVARSADAWFSQQPFAPTIFAEDLDAALRRCEPVFVVDVRDAASYAAGHVPGAVNIPLGVLFEPENLARLPTDGTRIVTICVTGHTASMATSVLGALGYEVVALRFGWLGWNGGKTKIFSATQDPGQTFVGGVGGIALPVMTGTEPGAYCE